MSFTAAVAEQAFVLEHVAKIADLVRNDVFAAATPEAVNAVVEGGEPLLKVNGLRLTRSEMSNALAGRLTALRRQVGLLKHAGLTLKGAGARQVR